MASLDRLLLQPLSPGAVRRAWLRDERLERRRSLFRAMAGRPRIGDRRRRTARVLHLARHLPGSGAVSGLCRPAPRAGLAPRAVWRPCARVLETRRYRPVPRVPGHHRSRAVWLGKGRYGLPPGLHLALRPGRDCRADGLVQRALQEDHLPGERSEADGGPCQGRRGRCPEEGPHTHPGRPRPGRRGGPHRGGASRRLGDRRGEIRRAGLEEPHPPGGRTRLEAILRGRSRLHRARRSSDRRARGARVAQRGPGTRCARSARSPRTCPAERARPASPRSARADRCPPRPRGTRRRR